MTDHTTTPTPTPPEGLTDEQLLEPAADHMEDSYGAINPDEYDPLDEKSLEVHVSELIAYGRAVIAAHEAARVGLHCYLDDDAPCPSPCVFDDPSERVDDCTYAQRLQRDGKPKTACSYYRPTPAPAPPHRLLSRGVTP